MWIINTLVNTDYLKLVKKGGTWSHPVGGGQLFNDNVYFVATKVDKNGKVSKLVGGNDNNFKLKVKPRDTIKWIVSPSNPTNDDNYGIVMYGFAKGSKWEGSLTLPSSDNEEIQFVELTHGFDDIDEPKDKYLKGSSAQISVPDTHVLASPNYGDTISYHLKLILIDLTDPKNPKPINYIIVDPKFIIEK
ncbi:Inclusion body protein [Tenacibaculum sp. 190524A02b]|uniref:hypothetical protein n=1 Tax=Tenacibaculum vairaonense TaxID=3137860 RepID=UPI0032B1BBF1